HRPLSFLHPLPSTLSSFLFLLFSSPLLLPPPVDFIFLSFSSSSPTSPSLLLSPFSHRPSREIKQKSSFLNSTHPHSSLEPWVNYL
ncbi:hypothetical protein F5H01DRAFT_380400, partial [Linnemannia elongata]